MKRKSMKLGRHREREETSSSDSAEISTKRFRPDLSPDSTNDEDQNDSDGDPIISASPSDEEEESEMEPLHSTLNFVPRRDLSFGNKADNNQDVMNNSCYDGYRSFMSSFQFFSDEDSSDSESQNDLTVMRKRGENSSMRSQKSSEQRKSEELNCIEHFVLQTAIRPNLTVFGFYMKDLEVVFMDHPSSVPIIGYLQVTLIAGKASIQGYNLKINEPITVFSQKQTGILSVTSDYCEGEKIWLIEKNLFEKLSENLRGVPIEIIKEIIKKNINNKTTVFIVQSCILPPELQTLQLYYPFATSFEKKNKSAKTHYVAYAEKEEHILHFGEQYENIFNTIHDHLLNINGRKPGEVNPVGEIENIRMNSALLEHDSNGLPDEKLTGFRILVSGPKKVGKSTMLRYLVNCFLNKYPEVYYLDTDPGQTEFTPPGAVSLVKVTKPVFGPPYSHLRRPIKSIFTGSITPEYLTGMHKRSVSKLINYFNANFPHNILLVNTIGWLTGTGDVIYQHIKKSLSAVVELHLESTSSNFVASVEKRLLKCKVGFERNAAYSTKKGDNRPADLRDYTVLSYLGHCNRSFWHPQTLNALRPYCICWDDIAVYNFSKRLMYTRYYEALNNSIVALCHVKKSYILNPTSPEYPVTLEEEPDNECLGYGFVRGVDEKNHLFFVVTPMLQNTLNTRVNAILCGNITVPRSVIYNQDILNVELAYTDGSKEGGTELRKAIRNRSRGHSSNDRSFYPS